MTLAEHAESYPSVIDTDRPRFVCRASQLLTEAAVAPCYHKIVIFRLPQPSFLALPRVTAQGADIHR
jgi:hypothetical protein